MVIPLGALAFVPLALDLWVGPAVTRPCPPPMRVAEESLLVTDLSYIAKTYAKKMEYPAWTRHGSEGMLAQRYCTLHVIGMQVDSKAGCASVPASVLG